MIAIPKVSELSAPDVRPSRQLVYRSIAGAQQLRTATQSSNSPGPASQKRRTGARAAAAD